MDEPINQQVLADYKALTAGKPVQQVAAPLTADDAMAQYKTATQAGLDAGAVSSYLENPFQPVDAASGAAFWDVVDAASRLGIAADVSPQETANKLASMSPQERAWYRAQLAGTDRSSISLKT